MIKKDFQNLGLFFKKLVPDFSKINAWLFKNTNADETKTENVVVVTVISILSSHTNRSFHIIE
jgi:hypothetical protein